MAINTQTIRIDLNTGRTIPVAFAHQNDTNRQLTFQLYNNGVAFTPSSTTVKFAYKSPIVNGRYSVITGSQMASGTVSGNTVTVTLPAAYTQVSGVGLLTMILTTSGNTLRPVNIKFVCQSSADGDDQILNASDWPEGLYDYMDNWLEENEPTEIANLKSEKLDKQKRFVEQTISPTDGYMMNVTNGSTTATAGTECLEYPVSEGETYRVSGWHFNATYCGLSLNPGLIRQTSTLGKYTVEVTIPAGVTSMRINGRTLNDSGPISVYKLVAIDSDTFWEEFDALKSKKPSLNSVGVSVGTDVLVFQHGLCDGYDVLTQFRRKPINNLLDFYGWYKVPNTGDDVVISYDPNTRLTILSGQTDFIQPFKIWAVNNGDGDFTDPTVRKFTGGWHGYNDKTTGDYSATARTANVTVTCDGKPVSNGNTAIGNRVVVTIENYIQASNTEKEDGTGREVLKATYECVFEALNPKIVVNCTLQALEDININTLYGLAYYRSATTDQCFAIGCHNNRAPFTLAETLNFDLYTTEIITHASRGNVSVGINRSLDVGSGYASERQVGGLAASGKAYMSMIQDATYSATSGFNLPANNQARWQGFYIVQPT